ncbi:MAG: HAD family hydrolase [Bacillota bacterium]
MESDVKMPDPAGVYAAKTLLPCRGIVFDKDGTLLDIWPMLTALAKERRRHLSARVRPDAVDAVSAAVGFDPRSGTIAPFGPLASAAKRDEIAIAAGALWAKGIPWHQAHSIARDSYDEADRTLDITAGVQAFPGVPETLAALSQAGLLLFVVTADSHDRAERMLSYLGLTQYITGIVGADEVTRTKPDPEAVLACAAKAGLAPGQIVVVGDGPQDALMGRRAGAKAIGVLTGVATYDDLQGYCDAVLPSVSDIRPA